MWNGKIKDFEGWQNIIERIGEFGYNKHRFSTDLFSNTPIVLTQNTINPDDLFYQNEKILEIMFEEYKCPMLLLCSQAVLNVLGNNQLSGTVVDMGESGTQISTVIDGYTQYNDCIYYPFLSGRNMTLLNNIERNSKSDMFDDREHPFDYLKYVMAKKIREEEANKMFKNKSKYIEEDFICANALYFYPKVFKNLLSIKNNPFKEENRDLFCLNIFGRLQRGEMNSSLYYDLKKKIMMDVGSFFLDNVKEEKKNVNNVKKKYF